MRLLERQDLLEYRTGDLPCRVLQPTKNPFIDTIKAVLNDVKWFLFLLLVTMFG